LVDMSGPEALSKRVQLSAASLRAGLEKGWSFRQLRYLGETTERDHLRLEWEPAVSLNYFGQVKAMGRGEREWSIGTESVGAVRSERGKRRYEVDVSLVVVNDELEISLAYSRERYGVERIEELAGAYLAVVLEIIRMRGEITESVRPETSPDASLAPLNQQEWDELLEEVEFEY